MSEEGPTARRRRAPAMSPDVRRQAIVRATIPLLTEHGANVTTSQIAKAAGIAEGTVFRAFKDKQELLSTCVRAALASNAELEMLERISSHESLEQRLTEATRAVTGFLDRMWALVATLQDSGFDPRGQEGRHKGPPPEMQRITTAIAGMFEPEADQLRVEPMLAARLLLGLVFTNRMQGKGFGEAFAEPEQLVDLFLNGVLRAPTPGGEQ
jgi:AcrR family transcriptional regulator